ncbi:hypothetical protein BABINDRAFT_159986 [Babjeviella inositovora NRRL Y-12698]|uniref:Mmc1 C-terminal domain-containing protein n=1 Tax=Babjeviella inositovora NRRL Y-12698 TaxID=984486 RepID=A0A1E3QVQ6_9ASCO|nr:uncharacterized protein BABINDRAFT_159986 [Babjeviella inositovora NRRL Y-12698]ODQ81740.1 hypothetical protein BABINDRAFT_159986 [Babjeviella inositovora NRRL Y-12698]
MFFQRRVALVVRLTRMRFNSYTPSTSSTSSANNSFDFSSTNFYDLTYTTKNNLMYNLSQYQNLYHPRFVNDYLHTKIDLVLNTLEYQERPIRIGILYEEHINKEPSSAESAPKSKFLESIVADPMMSDQMWYHSLKNRDFAKNNLIKYGPQFNLVNLNLYQDDYYVPLKYLNLQTKRNFVENECVGLHDIEILEINDLDKDSAAVTECHFYFLVTETNDCSCITDDPELHEIFWPLYKVNDKASDALPSSNELTLIDTQSSELHVNSALCFASNEQLIGYTGGQDDVGNAEAYNEIIRNIEKSNIFATLKFINYQTSAHVAAIKIIRLIISLSQYAVDISINELQRQANKKYLNSQIDKNTNDYMVECHKAFFHFKSLFLKEMRKDITFANILSRKDGVAARMERYVNATFPNQLFADYSEIQTTLGHLVNLRVKPRLVNPILAYKDEVLVPQRLPVLQQKLRRALFRNLLQMALPSAAIPYVGFYVFDLDPLPMVALSCFGLIMTIRAIYQQIDEIADVWSQDVLDTIKGLFWKIKDQLSKNYEIKYKDYEGLNTVKLNILKRLDTGIKTLEKEDAKRLAGGTAIGSNINSVRSMQSRRYDNDLF